MSMYKDKQSTILRKKTNRKAFTNNRYSDKVINQAIKQVTKTQALHLLKAPKIMNHTLIIREILIHFQKPHKRGHNIIMQTNIILQKH